MSEMRCLKIILNVTGRDQIRNDAIRAKDWCNTIMSTKTASQTIWPHTRLPTDTVPQKTFKLTTVVNRGRGCLHKRCREEAV